MSDQKPPQATPAEQAPEPAPAPPAPPSQEGCHFIVVPDSSAGTPEHYTVGSIEAMQKRLYEVLDRVEKGWCWVFVDGKPCKLHMPRQVFILELPDGKLLPLRPVGEEPVMADGSFYTLRPVKNPTFEPS